MSKFEPVSIEFVNCGTFIWHRFIFIANKEFFKSTPTRFSMFVRLHANIIVIWVKAIEIWMNDFTISYVISGTVNIQQGVGGD